MTPRFQTLLTLDLTIGLGSFPRERASVVQSFDARHAKSSMGRRVGRPMVLSHRGISCGGSILAHRSACATASIPDFAQCWSLPVASPVLRVECHTSRLIGTDLVPHCGIIRGRAEISLAQPRSSRLPEQCARLRGRRSGPRRIESADLHFSRCRDIGARRGRVARPFGFALHRSGHAAFPHQMWPAPFGA
jgi:hypothetical protein